MAIKGVDRSLLNPRDNWKNSVEYDKAAVKLVKLFEENFAQHFTLIKQKDKAVFPY
jgi:ATP-dependent phosphoenolpyruvate carboxykinase